LLEGDRAGAYRLIDEVLEKNPSYAHALVARAQLQLSDGKPEALASARAAVAADPNSPLAHYVLGKILNANDQLEDADAAFKEALRVSPGFAPANVELARNAINAGRYAEGAGYAQAAIDRVPGYAEPYLLLARAQIGNGTPQAAEKPLGLIVANFGDAPAIQAELGRLLLARSDLAGASAAYSKALAKDPLQIVALEGMVAVETRQGHVPAARKRLDVAVAAAPKNAELQLMAARLYDALFQDSAAAMTTVKRAMELNSNELGAYDLLARLYAKANDLPAATVEFEKLAQKQPKSVATVTTVGLLYHLQNKLDQAEAAYQRALALDPRAPIASNNLAELYLNRNEKLEIALQLAQTAKAGLPNAHQVDDTLGWVYYKKGMGPQAVTSMKAAVAAQPDNAVYLYHLGAAYALNKDKANARQALEKALKLQPNFPGSDDARKILTSLN
jgi:tetratricopeptide (TPR) repeat protein